MSEWKRRVRIVKPLHQANRRLDSHADMPRYARPAKNPVRRQEIARGLVEVQL